MKVRFELGAAVTKTAIRTWHPAKLMAIEAFGEELVSKFNNEGPPSYEDLLSADLITNEAGRTDRDSIGRALRRLGLRLVDQKSYNDYSWTVSPDRMGS